MNPALSALYDLQQIDSALALAHRRYQALDPGRAEKAAVQTTTELYERLTREHHATHADLRDSELELQAVETKKKEFEKKLYSGRVQNPKELVAMQEEIEALGRQRGRLDERILTLMDQLEMRRAEESEAQAKLNAAQAAFAKKIQEHDTAESALAGEIGSLTARRAQMAPAIPAAILKRYDSIRAAKQGIGIARIEGGSCGGCHTTLPLNLVRRVQETDSVELCENCGRMLCIGD